MNYKTNQVVLLEMPLALPRSFLTSSLGTFMNVHNKVGCNYKDSFALLALVECLNPQLALTHSFPLQVKLAHNLMDKSLGKTSLYR